MLEFKFDTQMLIEGNNLSEDDISEYITGNFEMNCDFKANEGDILKALIEKYNYISLTYIFYGDTRIMFDRFNQRENQPERGQANQLHSEIAYKDFDKWIKPLGDFTVGGKIVKIDTTNFNDVDFTSHIKTAQQFIQLN